MKNVLFILFLFPLLCHAQDTIWLTEGNTIYCKIEIVDEEFIHYSKPPSKEFKLLPLWKVKNYTNKDLHTNSDSAQLLIQPSALVHYKVAGRHLVIAFNFALLSTALYASPKVYSLIFNKALETETLQIVYISASLLSMCAIVSYFSAGNEYRKYLNKLEVIPGGLGFSF